MLRRGPSTRMGWEATTTGLAVTHVEGGSSSRGVGRSSRASSGRSVNPLTDS